MPQDLQVLLNWISSEELWTWCRSGTSDSETGTCSQAGLGTCALSCNREHDT